MRLQYFEHLNEYGKILSGHCLGHALLWQRKYHHSSLTIYAKNYTQDSAWVTPVDMRNFRHDEPEHVLLWSGKGGLLKVDKI